MNARLPIFSSPRPQKPTIFPPAMNLPSPISHRGASAPLSRPAPRPVRRPLGRLMSRVPHVLLPLFTFVFSLLTPAQAAPPTVTWDIQPRILNLGEAATATVTFHGANAPGALSLPDDIDGLSIQNAGVTHQNINGARSVLFAYRIFPRRAGEFTLGPYRLDAEGNDPAATLDAITLSVRAPDPDAPQGEMLFARIHSSAPAPFVQQTFDIVLSVYALPTVELARDIRLAGGFPESGFVQGPFEELPTVREEVDGQIYVLRRFRARFRALTAGDFDITPTLQVGVVDRSAQNSRRRSSPFGTFFDDPFFDAPPVTPVTLSTAPLALHIRPVPAEGRPADYSGAVGQFRFDVDVKPRELKVGEPLTVTLRVSGRGNIAAVLPPSYADSPLYKTYEARQSGESPDPAAESGVKTFEQVVIPRSVDLAELPALSFSVFDPEAAAYRTLAAGPFPLTVHESETGASALLMQIPDADDASRARALVLGTDIVYIQPAPSRWLRPSDSPLTPFAVATTLGFALPPVLLAALAFSTRRRNRLASDVAYARRRQAPRAARSALRRAEEAAHAPTPDPRAVFELLSDAAVAYFSHRLNLPPGAATPAALLDLLSRAPLPPESLARWREFFDLSDRVRYGAAADLDPAALQTWTQTLATLLREAERTRLP